MEDTALNKDRTDSCAVARLIAEHNGVNTVVLDLTGQSGFADFFVIATATSFAHLHGLARQVDEWGDANGLERLNRQRSFPGDDEWILMDFGNIVVHLMTEQARSFYDLEKLWFAGTVIFPS